VRKLSGVYALNSASTRSVLCSSPVVSSTWCAGSVSRRDVYQYLKRFYAKHGLVAFVRQMMPEDTKQVRPLPAACCVSGLFNCWVQNCCREMLSRAGYRSRSATP
jgi:hypothetical protein